MPDSKPDRRYRFGIFEADATVGELRRQGVRVKLNAQPFQVLMLLLERPGELLTREEISRELWPEGTFVDFERGVNSAVNRIREALGDTASNPRFVETLARRGYRFVAPVERMGGEAEPVVSAPVGEEAEGHFLSGILATPEELPRTSYAVVQALFIGLQLMYLGFYVGALANFTEIDELVSALPRGPVLFIVLMVLAALLIPLRAFVISMVMMHAPGARRKYLRLWPGLLGVDLLWALSPFLLLHHLNFGVAVACTALLVYSPFAQRSLVLMGAGGVQTER